MIPERECFNNIIISYDTSRPVSDKHGVSFFIDGFKNSKFAKQNVSFESVTWGKNSLNLKDMVDFSGFRVEESEEKREVIIGPYLDKKTKQTLNHLINSVPVKARGSFEQDLEKVWPQCILDESGIVYFFNKNFEILLTNDGSYEVSEEFENDTLLFFTDTPKGRVMTLKQEISLDNIFPYVGEHNYDTFLGISILINDYQFVFNKIKDKKLNEADIRKYVNPFIIVREKKEVLV